MRTITLEEHFVTQSFLKAVQTYGSGVPPALAPMQAKLLDVGGERLAAMDEAGISMQVLSLAAIGMDSLDATTATAVTRDVNDELAAAVTAHPDRFAGFATLGLKEPASAAKELERCVRQLGLRGAFVDGTVDGKFLDQPEFFPVFEAAASLGVPVYLHPAPPPEAVQQAYFSGLPSDVGYLLSIAGWGWHAETGLHTLRLITTGLFERLPELRLIIGHMGEGLPYALARSSSALSGAAKLSRTVAETFRANVHVTTSGYFTLPPFRCALEVIGIDRLLFSIDYPFSANTKGKDFLETLELNEDDLAKFTHGNAERLLRL